jgi:putative endonuclease
MMNKWNTTSYIGVTSKLLERVWQHKQKLIKGFTERYNLNKLVYYEVCETAHGAVAREKQLKKWSRKKKVELIKKQNPELKDLSDDLEV